VPFDLQSIQTIVIVMMENRSFDNLLGYRGLPPYESSGVGGIKSDPTWLSSTANPYGGHSFTPHPLEDPFHSIDTDPHHERIDIATQIARTNDGRFRLNGFVQSYANSGGHCLDDANPPPVMGYFGEKEAPITNFFADRFSICDRWFSSLPAGTQPNRLMAMSGFSLIDTNQTPLPDQEILYDWLTQHGIRWRVYHQGFPFFGMMPRWTAALANYNRFRPFAELSRDIQSIPPDKFPQVIFIEPLYTDSPHIGSGTDDHSPSAIRGGQEFLLQVYHALTSEPDFFSQMAVIVTYDEHGGFFDHVEPPNIATLPPASSHYPPFDSLGVRVPTFVISPFVREGGVCHDVFDHTSILKLIGERFGPQGRYSEIVDARPVSSLSRIFADEPARKVRAAPHFTDGWLASSHGAGFTPGTSPSTEIQRSFQIALDYLRKDSTPKQSLFDELFRHFPARRL